MKKFFGRHGHQNQQPQTFSLSECLKCKLYVARPGCNQELKIQHSNGGRNKYWCNFAVDYVKCCMITAKCRMSWGSLNKKYSKGEKWFIYMVIHKSLRDFRTRLRNNQTDTAERRLSIGRESLQVFFCTRGLGVIPGSTSRG